VSLPDARRARPLVRPQSLDPALLPRGARKRRRDSESWIVREESQVSDALGVDSGAFEAEFGVEVAPSSGYGIGVLSLVSPSRSTDRLQDRAEALLSVARALRRQPRFEDVAAR
jgi:hypothetical protein